MGIVRSLTAYSDSSTTVETPIFNYDDTAYFNAEMTATIETVSSSVVLKTYTTAGVEVDTVLDTTYSFVTNTVVSLTTINSGAAVSQLLDSASYPGGDYYAELAVTGTDVDDAYIRCYFSVVDAPVISSVSISDTSINQDSSVFVEVETSAEADRVFIQFFDSSGDPVYTKELTSSDGTTWTGRTEPMKIPIDTYGAGDVWVTALNDEDAVIDITSGVSDKTLSLTVSTAEGMRVGAIRWLNQTVYIKHSTGTLDAFGNMTYGEWTATAARIMRTTKEVMVADGSTVVSSAQVFVSGSNSVSITDRLRFSNDYSDTAEAEILTVETSVDATGNGELKVIYT